MTNWGLHHVTIESRFKVLDIGCGGGATVQKLAAIAEDGMVCGIDYAEGSVAVSRKINSQLIEAKRVVIQKASVSHLPFPDDTFDLVTAIETQYYWPDLVRDMREILRVLKPRGKLVVIAEMYKGGEVRLAEMTRDVVIAVLTPGRERSSRTVRIRRLCECRDPRGNQQRLDLRNGEQARAGELTPAFDVSSLERGLRISKVRINKVGAPADLTGAGS